MNPTPKHIVQSPEWAEVKTKNGTPAVQAGSLFYTKHKIPFTSSYYGYCPKVDPSVIDFALLRQSAEEQNVIAINFDCPNVTKDNPRASEFENILKHNCKPSMKNTFAKFNILLDLNPSLEELLTNMHHKTRYNIKYAEKNGITIREGKGEDIKIFTKLQKQTAERQKFYIHSDRYYETIWEIFSAKGIAKLLIAEYKGEPVSAWMFYIYDNVLYYPYGGWSGNFQNLFPNNLVCWEGIKLGKAAGCISFDMWGASKDPEDASDPYHGFTKFKLNFGGKHVEYINSYDFVINSGAYATFNIANKIRWAILKAVK